MILEKTVTVDRLTHLGRSYERSCDGSWKKFGGGWPGSWLIVLNNQERKDLEQFYQDLKSGGDMSS